MNAAIYRRSARESRKVGKAFASFAFAAASVAGGSLIKHWTWLLVASALVCVFFSFIAIIAYRDAADAEALADEWENQNDHDGIGLP